jgi:hypothetical protein
VHKPTRVDLDRELQRRRGVQIIDGMQGKALRAGRLPLSEDEQRVALESVTNLPADLIPEVVSPVPVAPAPRQWPWMDDFPFPIKEVMATAAAAKERAARGRAARPQQTRTRSRS